MLPLEDRVLLEDTLVSLSVEDSVIKELMTMLQTQEIELENNPPHTVQETWFGGSHSGGTRLAANAGEASLIVEAEMKNMIAGLAKYRELIGMFADDVKGTDESVAYVNRAPLADIEACTDLNAATTCVPSTEGS